MSGEVVFPGLLSPTTAWCRAISTPWKLGFFGVAPNNVRYYGDGKLLDFSAALPAWRVEYALQLIPVHSQSEDTTMSAPYSGLPAATSVEQSIIFAQLELLRRLDPARVLAARAVLLRN
jgi:hypothetical protein